MNPNSNRLTLRAPEPHDIDMIYVWENVTDEAHTSLRTGPLSRHRIKSFVENYDGDIHANGSLRFMIDFEGMTVGTIDIFDYDMHGRHAFVGIYVEPRSRRKGIGLEALRQVERIILKSTGIHSLAALVAVPNVASRALFEAAGYREAGRLAGWLIDGPERIDAIIYQHILS